MLIKTIIKKVEEERIRHNEQRVKELTKEVLNLKDRQNQLLKVERENKDNLAKMLNNERIKGRT